MVTDRQVRRLFMLVKKEKLRAVATLTNDNYNSWSVLPHEKMLPYNCFCLNKDLTKILCCN